MTKKHVTILTFIVVFAVLLVGCISTSSEPEIVSTRVVRPLPTAAPPAGPPPSFSLDIGSALYATSCAACHGDTGLGDGGTAAAFTCPMPAFASASPDEDLTEWYELVANGNGGTPDCLMPPWSARLTTDEMWQTVAFARTLSYDLSLQAQGDALLTAAATGDTAYLRETTWQIENTDADILVALTTNSLDGFDFAEPLSDADQQAALVAIRLSSFGAAPEVAAQQGPQPAPESTEDAEEPAPIATEDVEEPAAVEATEAPTTEATEEPAAAEPAATEEADIPPPIDENTDTFTINGTIVNATTDAAVPDDLVLTLRVVGLGADETPVEVYTAETSPNGGSFTFAGVPIAERALASVETEYGGVRQFAPQLFPAGLQSDTVDLVFTLYETTTDPNDVNFTIVYSESLIDAVSAENAALVFQSLEIANTADRIYVGEEDVAVILDLPLDALNPQANARNEVNPRIEYSEADNEFRYFPPTPLFPGFLDRMALSFNKRYDGSMRIEQTFSYEVQELSVYLSQPRGLEIEGERFVPIEPGDLNGVTYEGYTLASMPLPAGQEVNYQVLDGEDTPATATGNQAADDGEGGFLEDNTTLILGLGILLIIAGGMFMFYDIQKQRLKAQTAPAGSPVRRQAAASKDDLIAAIAELDAAFEAGEIDEADYQSERERLKALLRQKV